MYRTTKFSYFAVLFGVAAHTIVIKSILHID